MVKIYIEYIQKNNLFKRSIFKTCYSLIMFKKINNNLSFFTFLFLFIFMELGFIQFKLSSSKLSRGLIILLYKYGFTVFDIFNNILIIIGAIALVIGY